jgi:hypothetical protein
MASVYLSRPHLTFGVMRCASIMLCRPRWYCLAALSAAQSHGGLQPGIAEVWASTVANKKPAIMAGGVFV